MDGQVAAQRGLPRLGPQGANLTPHPDPLALTLTLSLTFHPDADLTKAVWVVANAPLLLLNLLCWCFGIPLSMLLLTHTFFACTSTTTYEWLKLEKLEYMQAIK